MGRNNAHVASTTSACLRKERLMLKLPIGAPRGTACCCENFPRESPTKKLRDCTPRCCIAPTASWVLSLPSQTPTPRGASVCQQHTPSWRSVGPRKLTADPLPPDEGAKKGRNRSSALF